MTMLRLIRAELLKLREPMTLLALLGPAALVAALSALGVARAPRQMAWADLLPTFLQFWAMMLFPLSVVAFTAFAGHIEHRARAWDHILSLPAPKWMVFAAKAAVVAAGAMATYGLFVAAVLAGGAIGGALSPNGMPRGTAGLDILAPDLARSAGAGLLMIVIQLWIALRLKSFIAPIMIGLGAWAVTMISLMFQSADDTKYWPWSLPYRVVLGAFQGRLPGNEALRDDIPVLLTIGVAGGLAALTAMILDLSRREMR